VDATTFTKNRDRLLEADVAKEFLARVVEQARGKGLTSDEHFTVDGTLLEAWASAKSFQPKDRKEPPAPDDSGNPTVNFHAVAFPTEAGSAKGRSFFWNCQSARSLTTYNNYRTTHGTC
jgi:hypothetical protein